jgi:hypothetical protein
MPDIDKIIISEPDVKITNAVEHNHMKRKFIIEGGLVSMLLLIF